MRLATRLARLLGTGAALRRDRRGTAVVEMAFALPIMVMLSLGFVDVARGFSYQMALAQYAQSGADLVLASFPTTPTDTEIKTQITTVSGIPAANITITRWTECNYGALPAVQACPAMADLRADFMRIKVVDTFSPILNVPGYADMIKQMQMSSQVVVRIK